MTDILLRPFVRVQTAIAALREEVAVLRMMGGALAIRAQEVADGADRVDCLGEESSFEVSVSALNIAVARLWLTANGDDEGLHQAG